MSSIISSSSATKIVRRATLADHPFSAQAVARDRVVVPGSSTSSTVKDCNILTHSGSTVAHEFDVVAVPPECVITNNSPSVVSIDGPSATRLADGTADLTVTSGPISVRLTFSVSQSTDTTTSFTGFVSGSLAAHMQSQVNTLLAASSAPTWGPVNGTAQVTASNTHADLFDLTTSPGWTRRTNSWWGAINTTGVSATVDVGWTAISKRDALGCWHGGFLNQTQDIELWFYDNSSTWIKRTVPAGRVKQIDGTDLAVMTWDSDLPAGITPLKLFPTNFRNYLPQPQYGYPFVRLSQDLRLVTVDSVSETTFNGAVLSPSVTIGFGQMWNFGQPADATRSPWYYACRGGDSGSGIFAVINGELVLFGVTTFGIPSSYVLSDHLGGINAAMASNESPYTLSTVDLSGFNSY